MDTRTLEALKASIEKWERNAVASRPEDVRTKCADCPLCTLFYAYDCDGCPVEDHTGQERCEDTPYYDAVEGHENWKEDEGAAFRASARKEVDLLKSLLPNEGE